MTGNGNTSISGTLSMGGLVTFAAGQTFPGTGTVTSVAAGAGLSGGSITTSGTLSLDTGFTNNLYAQLAPAPLGISCVATAPTGPVLQFNRATLPADM